MEKFLQDFENMEFIYNWKVYSDHTFSRQHQDKSLDLLENMFF